MDLTAVICTYNRYDYLDRALKSLVAQQADGVAYDILVVDNTPPGPEREKQAARFRAEYKLSYVTCDKAGLANARNVAAATSKAEIIAFLDDDAVAVPGWVAALHHAFAKAGPKAMIGGGPVRPEYEVPRPRWLHDKLLTYLTVIDWGDQTRFLDRHEWVAGANISYRRQAYLDGGGCNVSLGRIGENGSLLSNEETELTNRLQDAGGRTLYVPGAEVTHFVPAKRMTREWFRQRVIWQAISDQMLKSLTPAECAKQAEGLAAYIAAVPPRHRTTNAFYYDAEEPDMFYWQMQALYDYTRLTLSSGKLF
jgi:GT2 family glycosyltransferase